MVSQKVKSLRWSRRHIRARMYSSELSGKNDVPAANIVGGGKSRDTHLTEDSVGPKVVIEKKKYLAQAGNLTKNPA